MINFLKNIFEKKTPDVVFWCEKEGLDKINPIKKSITQIPQWFKDITIKKGNIKSCPGIIDYFNLGYIHYLWTDIMVEIPDDDNKPTTYTVPDPDNFKIQFHHKSTYLDFLPIEKYKFVLKPISPWRCKTKKGIKLLQLPLYYEFNEIFDVMPGTINTSYYHQLHPQICFKKTGRFMLPRGMPLCMFVPIKEDKLTMEIFEKSNITTKWENEARMLIQTKFPGEYKRIKNNDDNNKT
jgi:hypothetical protein